MGLIPNWQDQPRWLKRVFLFVGLPAWLGLAALLFTGRAFEYEIWTILLFGIFFGVCVLNLINGVSVALTGRFSWLIAALGLGIVAIPVALFVTRERPPAPAIASAFGCYATVAAPAIRLDRAGMQIVQPGFPRVAFHLERGKQGIALIADRPIEAQRSPAGYRYTIAGLGSGRYLDFYRVDGGRVYGVFEESELSGFRMLAEDGAYLPYDRADAARCAAG